MLLVTRNERKELTRPPFTLKSQSSPVYLVHWAFWQKTRKELESLVIIYTAESKTFCQYPAFFYFKKTGHLLIQRNLESIRATFQSRLKV